MAPWFGFLISLQVPVLAWLLLKRFREDSKNSLRYMQFKANDVKIAFQLLMVAFFGILAFVGYRMVFDTMVTVAGAVTGTIATMSVTVALLILNIAARKPDNRYSKYLPSSMLDSVEEYPSSVKVPEDVKKEVWEAREERLEEEIGEETGNLLDRIKKKFKSG